MAARVTAAQARWLSNRLERCGCEKWKPIGVACGCGQEDERRAIATGDRVAARSVEKVLRLVM